jgi:acyl-CoA reductase-like NAD-dependent aldehyde dehydrogenase
MTGKDQLARIAAQVEEATNREEGTILCGGCTLRGKEYERGFFYQPTLVTDVAPGTSLVTNEIFGPVLPVMTIPDLDAAIGEANRTRYGLGASVWTKDIGTVKRVYREVRAGIIWVNRHLTLPPEIPFGGVNESGIGRENGFNALESYSRTKTLYLGW